MGMIETKAQAIIQDMTGSQQYTQFMATTTGTTLLQQIIAIITSLMGSLSICTPVTPAAIHQVLATPNLRHRRILSRTVAHYVEDPTQQAMVYESTLAVSGALTDAESMSLYNEAMGKTLPTAPVAAIPIS